MALKLHYKNHSRQSVDFLFVACAQDYELFLGDEYRSLPSLSGPQAEKFLENYNKFIEKCGTLNRNNKFFFMTPIALRNTWQSSFYHGAESFSRLQEMEEGDVVFFSPEWFLWAAQKMNVQATQEDVQQARRDLYKLPLYRLYMAYQGLRFSWARRVPYKIPADLPRFFMASIWTKAGVEKWNQEQQEPFYGELPLLLQQRGYKTTILYHAEAHHEEPDQSGGVSAMNMASCLRPVDWLCLAWENLFFKSNLPKELEFPMAAVQRDIANSLSNQIPLALISYKAVKNLIASCKAEFISLYENNCWEQGLLKAAHEGGRKVISFQHTAFAPALLKMDGDLSDKAMPDKLITTGHETASILKDVMRYQGKIKIGCALRYKSEHLIIAGQEKKILVLLQGVPDDSLFLHIVSQHFNPEDMIIRSHPSWPLRNERFSFSQNSLSADLSQAAVVLYTGTTAAFEAFSANVPVIHMHLGGPLTADPLFRLQNCAVKKTWSEGDDLEGLIQQIETITEGLRASAFETAHKYINSYFSPADAAAMDNLLRQITDE